MENNGSKRRKICEVDDGDDEEDQIEKFFALVESIREARDLLKNGSDHAMQSIVDRKREGKVEEGKQQVVAVWKPSFQIEDFIEEAQVRNPALVDSSRTTKVADENGEIKESLDLRLSL